MKKMSLPKTQPSYGDLLAYTKNMARLMTLDDCFAADNEDYDDPEDMRADLSDDRLLDEFSAFEAMIVSARDLVGPQAFDPAVDDESEAA
ncbi:hypothetical protein H9Q09_01015 [Aurantimonas sp. DM33-3]|uniref:hypothetical protein n=1 Tax=Aurantimonas sp. DM33-3 TaxID=2766955 RepID=UPI001651C7E7|nr:hypothetical protein [Aurantimonas sp. DM33-3]MBC6714765.1 hypothetical protein [Aurantimonas sp. DM33-3]